VRAETASGFLNNRLRRIAIVCRLPNLNSKRALNNRKRQQSTANLLSNPPSRLIVSTVRMTIHLSSAVIHGHLSNEIPGLVTGQLHFAGMTAPVQIELDGDFLRDIAGCRIEFSNPLPEVLPGQTSLVSPQAGVAGEMTASRRIVRTPGAGRSRAGTVRSGLKNLLFLEWFNDRNQRVVVQSWHWNLRVSAPVWRQSPDQEHARIKRSRALRKRFLLDRPRRSPADPSFDQPAPDDPFASIAPVGNPFEAPLEDARPGSPRSRDGKDPFSSAALSAQIAARALAAELCDLETHLGVVPRVKAREALLDLLSSIADISAQLRQTLFQIATTKPDCWPPLVTDVEQSIPLFSAAGATCDALVEEGELTHPGWWNNACSRLAAIVTHSETLLNLLRAD
jgi:hypothetical protein